MRSIRSRLTLLFVVLVGVLLTLFSVGFYFTIHRAWERELEDHLETEQREFQAYFLDEYDEFLRGVHEKIEPELESFCTHSGALAVVQRADGETLFQSRGLAPAPSGEGRFLARVEGRNYRGIRGRVSTETGETFLLSLAVSQKEYEVRLKLLRRFLITFTVLALGISGLLGYFFVGRTLAPIEGMRHQAERISREHLRERIPEPSARGEFLDLARTLNEMLDRLAKSIGDLEALTADAAHELRTPLSTLRAQVETAIQEPRSVEEYERILSSVLEDTSYMSRIVEDLFILAKIDMKQYPIEKKPVALPPLLQEMQETWLPMAEEYGVTIEIGGTGATVTTDPVALRRILMNLVENAVKYNREGGRVTLSAETSSGGVRIRVADTGIGISSEHLPHLFQRFYRADKARSRETGGSGLGLAICRSLSEALGGGITVESISGKGSTFTVELPPA